MSRTSTLTIVEHLRVLIGGLPAMDFAEVSAKRTDYTLLNSNTTNLEYERVGTEYRVLVKLLKNGRLTSVIGEDITKAGLSDLVHKAHDQLKFAPLIESFSVAPLRVKPEYSNLDWGDPTLELIGTKEKIQRMRNLEKKVLAFDRRITETKTYYDEKIEDVAHWNKGASHPIRRRISKIDIGAEASAGNERGPTSARANDTQTQFYNLDWKIVASRCAKRCVSRIGAEPVASGAYKVLLSSRIAQRLICCVFEALRGDQVIADRSFLSGVFGQRVFSDKLTLIDDPYLGGRSGNTLWDDQGVMTQRRTLIDRGRVISFAHNLHSAKQLRVPSTGHAKRSFETARHYVAAHNLYMEPSRLDQVDLLSQVRGGLYLVETQAPLSFSSKTGDFVLKARGYKVLGENEYAPIEGATLKSNFRELLSSISSVGRDLKWGEHYGAPAFVIESIRVEGD